MPETGKLFHLPDRTRGAPDSGLQDFLRENRTTSVRISAGSVTRVDVRLLQLILSAARSWQERGLDLCLCDIPAPVVRTLGQLGVAPEMLRQEGAQ
jgi:anti-anti-sigma regulatory factor